MCTVCRSLTTCYQGCPNAPEPRKVCTCGKCNDDIVEGDEYYQTPDGEALCGDCADGMTTCELLAYMGCERVTAEVDDYD